MKVEYAGQLQNYKSWTDDDGWGVRTMHEKGDVVGTQGDQADLSSKMYMDRTELLSNGATGDLFGKVTVRDTDGKPNLKVDVNDYGDVTIENKGDKSAGRLTFKNALPTGRAIKKGRKEIKKAEARGEIQQVFIENGEDWGSPYGFIRVN